MLKVVIPPQEIFDEETQEFRYLKAETFQIEHSLVSIAKWESKWQKPFFKSEKTKEEALDYIRCMTITQNVKPEVYYNLTSKNADLIDEYINSPMTATWFNDEINKHKSNSEVVTSELIYYWMLSHNIPMECQKWHINRLLTLIRVFNIKNSPPKKMSKSEMLDQRKHLNAIRKAKHNSKG